MESLKKIAAEPECAVYEIAGDGAAVRRLIASTPETRAICNDPFVVGVEYTDKLEAACAKVLSALGAPEKLALSEADTTVLHILRGGLNFGLRGALAAAYGWNLHSSAFISAQRARRSENTEDWCITENAYQKVFLGKHAAIVFGDVVATGTSLEFALHQLLDIVETEGASVRSVVFFTIGGMRSEQIVAQIDGVCRGRFTDYQGATVVYFEGRFDVAAPESKLSIKLTGTDLLRSNSLLAPEFIQSQYQNPAYPIERCTIYDAGSRAFHIPEYLDDVRDYWKQTLHLASGGMSFAALLKERFPELEAGRFSSVDLRTLAEQQLER